LGSFFSGCKTATEPVSDPSAIIGQDDRITVRADGAVGYITDGNLFCSATAFSPQRVVTAAHCIDLDLQYRFVQKDKTRQVTRVSLSKKYDIAFLELDGRVEQWIPLGGQPDRNKPATLVSVNKSDVSKYLVSSSGNIEPGPSGIFYHTFDTTEGTSGSPMLQDDRIVAVHIGTVDDQTKNLAVSPEFLENFKLPDRFQFEACSIKTPTKCSTKDVVDAVKDATSGVVEIGGCVLASTFTPALVSGFDAYRGNLRSRSGIVRTRIPTCLDPLVSQRYGFDPAWVEIFTNVSGTPAGNAITLENQVFLPISVDFERSPSDLAWLLHELEHVVQWKNKGRSTFLAEYICDTGRNVTEFNQLRIHESLKIERAAESKSNALIGYALGLCASRSSGSKVSFRSFNFPDRYIRHQNSEGRIDPINSDLERMDATFYQVRGLADNSCISFEASNYPGHFLRHRGFKIYLDKADASDLFAADATFCERPGRAGGGTSFESWNYPGHFLRHSGFSLFVSADSGALANQDSSFYRSSPFVP
jgi:hypothetical protein